MPVELAGGRLLTPLFVLSTGSMLDGYGRVNEAVSEAAQFVPKMIIRW